MRTIIGIDPGLSGAVCIRDYAGTIHLVDTPVMGVKKGKKSGTEYLPAEMADLLRCAAPQDIHVFIESVHSMPKQGVSSTFTFGKGFGIWIGIIAALKLPHSFVTPQAWKKTMMEGIADKDAARIRAQQLYPALMPALKLKKHIGRADALLIMEHGRRSLKRAV